MSPFSLPNMCAPFAIDISCVQLQLIKWHFTQPSFPFLHYTTISSHHYTWLVYYCPIYIMPFECHTIWRWIYFANGERPQQSLFTLVDGKMWPVHKQISIIPHLLSSQIFNHSTDHYKPLWISRSCVDKETRGDNERYRLSAWLANHHNDLGWAVRGQAINAA